MDLGRRGQTSAPPQRALRTLARVHVPPIVQRHPALRWLAPLAVVGVVGVVATGVFGAQARSESLPEVSAGALLTDAQRADVRGFSGTVVSRLSLGLPEMPSLTQDADATGSSLASLLSGSHTLKVWYGGPTKQRIALLGATDETDLFRSDRTLWQWTSSSRTAVRTKLPQRDAERPEPTRTMTPGDVADGLLRDLDPSTSVTVHADREVANRRAYELVLTPKRAITKVGSVHIALDGATKVPLSVRVFARGARTAAVDITYTSINFTAPSDSSFDFTPPDGATVRTVPLSRLAHPGSQSSGVTESPRSSASSGSAGSAPVSGAARVTRTGDGWATVWTYRTGRDLSQSIRGPLKEASTRVYGPWGAGRLITSDLLSVLVTNDGRVLAGAVDANTLFAAAN